MFSTCKTEGLHGDVLHVATEIWTEDVGADPERADKRDARLVWRGSNTGVLVSPEVHWNLSQRIRFISMVNEHTSSPNYSVLMPTSELEEVGPPQNRSQAWMNRLTVDASFTREPVQCRLGACEEMWQMFEFRNLITQSQHNQHKYIFDIDGNGWSARFKRLITTRSAAAALGSLHPGSDGPQRPLYDILTFFRDDVWRGGASGHDELAQKIAAARRQWSLSFWRKRDMVAYMWRLWSEYGRLMSDHPDEKEFELPRSFYN
ncbi:glycosyltransferase family 90 protein [Calocera viscosa TUFC12733]|uniref:Glycosyltransferase family 90 protein n=1 Tax=Calocera viscosa (strain TUFC12733) TaxID=1330018 RepID=A0A167HBU5_CALVF|nr:glycosyltransferase family 90 protein [Calocera viscosa TUFC12733]